MRRIIVYGVTGSGESTLAARIGQRLGLPYHSVDDLTWEPGWIALPERVQRERIAAICATDSWVLDAAYTMWQDIALLRADLVVGGAGLPAVAFAGPPTRRCHLWSCCGHRPR